MSVLVFGDIMLDKYIDGTVSRISPEAPVPVVNVQNVYNAIGGCGNVSCGIAALEVATEDVHSTELLQLLKKHKVHTKLIEQQLPTITKVRVVSNKHQLLRFDIEKIAPPNAKVELQIEKVFQNSKAKIAVISDYGKGICTTTLCNFLIKKFNLTKRKILVDPKNADWTKYSGAYLISPNFKEFCEAIGKSIPNENASIELHGRKLMERYHIDNILITRSAKGMSLITKQNALHIPTIAKEVYDVTGAGDTVIATIAAMLSKGKSLKEAVLLSNKAAAISVAHFGTYTVTKKELLAK
jgi:D-beta-D-heptose 7-phosphate kinase/D-beta-D-heptose 1-phosphate adenosyltransferase